MKNSYRHFIKHLECKIQNITSLCYSTFELPHWSQTSSKQLTHCKHTIIWQFTTKKKNIYKIHKHCHFINLAKKKKSNIWNKITQCKRIMNTHLQLKLKLSWFTWSWRNWFSWLWREKCFYFVFWRNELTTVFVLD